MVELICERRSCIYCMYDKCENEKVKEDFKNVETVTKVVLSVSRDSCRQYDEDESLCDPRS